GRIHSFIMEHSLTIMLVVTGTCWALLYARIDANSRWGQVVGNILSEWVALLGLVLLTKRFFEKGSQESRRQFSDRPRKQEDPSVIHPGKQEDPSLVPDERR